MGDEDGVNTALLAALKAMVKEVRSYHPTFDARVFVQAERAIAKATKDGK